jgi:hypothetical protein
MPAPSSDTSDGCHRSRAHLDVVRRRQGFFSSSLTIEAPLDYFSGRDLADRVVKKADAGSWGNVHRGII